MRESVQESVKEFVEQEEQQMELERTPGRYMYPLREWPRLSNQCWADADIGALLTMFSYPDIRRSLPPILGHITGLLSGAMCKRDYTLGNKNLSTFIHKYTIHELGICIMVYYTSIIVIKSIWKKIDWMFSTIGMPKKMTLEK